MILNVNSMVVNMPTCFGPSQLPDWAAALAKSSRKETVLVSPAATLPDGVGSVVDGAPFQVGGLRLFSCLSVKWV